MLTMLGGWVQPVADLEVDVMFDPKTAHLVRELSAAKEKAVADEDYEEAKRLKFAIEYLRGVCDNMGGCCCVVLGEMSITPSPGYL